jgi:hypothetical protein
LPENSSGVNTQSFIQPLPKKMLYFLKKLSPCEERKEKTIYLKIEVNEVSYMIFKTFDAYLKIKEKVSKELHGKLGCIVRITEP